MITFYKYEGTGNDFILIDDRKNQLLPQKNQIQKMCDRHFGIGADGLILIREKRDFDFEMVYYNSDGNLGSMCGNGGRCAAAFVHRSGFSGKNINFLAADGSHQAQIIQTEPYLVKLQMNNVEGVEISPTFTFMNTGSPHYTCFRNNVNGIDVVQEGRKIRNSERFKQDGTNVNFVEQKNGSLLVRTYERGVENETLSCGTGVTASVLSAAATGLISGMESRVETPGGILKVYFQRNNNGFTDIWLEGNVHCIFKGEINDFLQ